jgi:PRC-barrel domain
MITAMMRVLTTTSSVGVTALIPHGPAKFRYSAGIAAHADAGRDKVLAVIAAEHIEDWRGAEVRDPADQSLGKLQEVFLDGPTGTPILFAIKSGLLGRHFKLIPADGAMVGPGYVRVNHDKAKIDGSPDSDREQTPDAEALDEIGKAYGLRFSEKVSLASATALETRRAEAAEARRRADQLEAEAAEKAAAHEQARSRYEGASAEAERAEREAAQAREAAAKARAEAERHDGS